MPIEFPGLLARLRDASHQASHRLRVARRLAALRRAVAAERPAEPRATVVVTGLSPKGLTFPGKVEAATFFPPFAARLGRDGVATALVTDEAELSEAMATGPAVLVHVYREVGHRIDTPAVIEAERRAAGVFNGAASGPIIADKVLTHERLTGHGVPMPSLEPDGLVFSNDRHDSGAAVAVLGRLDEADAGRYNTAFVDTRVTHEGRTYYTSVRLVCVGARILHGYVRARDASEGSPSVHAADTPVDPGLIEMLQERQVTARMAELADIAARVADAFGPGFYAHDLLVPADGGPAQLCETGYKFNDRIYARRLAPVAAEVPSHARMFAMEDWAGQSAGLFLDECARLGYL